MITMGDIIVLSILAAGVAWSLGRKKLTVAAAITGALLGWGLYWGAGYAGLAMMTVFFIAGTVATSWKKAEKYPLKPAEGLHQTRNMGQVLANAGVAGLAAGALLLWPGGGSVLRIMIAAAFSAASADTLASELGMVYGRRFYNILSLRPDEKGRDGVVSVEGFLFGIGGSVLIALVYAIGYGSFAAGPLAVIVIAGTIGNIMDSVLGATVERAGLFSNDLVNFFNTLTATLIAGLLAA
jgi:uncharacterized protein (TIGR00297 family)